MKKLKGGYNKKNGAKYFRGISKNKYNIDSNIIA